MQGVLYVSHGTRYEKGKQEAIDFIRSIQSEVDAPLQEICFLEINNPNVEEGIQKLVEAGAQSISVVPILLLTAGHALKDIPMELEKAQQKYPSISFTYGEPLGVQDRLIDVVEERIREVNEDSDVLLVGRGSYDPQTRIDIESIAGSLEKRLGRKVETAYLAAIKPSFDEALEQVKDGRALIVAPYLWFDGLLIQSMNKKVEALNDKGLDVVLAHYLSDHPNFKEALVDRVHQSFEMPFSK
ncbi:sirohydrochlorin chelatase [Halobacillus sp. Marseille-Q1614]|uniref:sirohydrochlorin chelatase n=1 Tax=Halobacillus sp. Marseille-Q1614 TaxID=2709134 RepID=UPI00156DE36D|nr:sirohydrochlorin chelatase [Halobacillus sp. Marseille-Q1614]